MSLRLLTPESRNDGDRSERRAGRGAGLTGAGEGVCSPQTMAPEPRVL